MIFWLAFFILLIMIAFHQWEKYAVKGREEKNDAEIACDFRFDRELTQRSV